MFCYCIDCNRFYWRQRNYSTLLQNGHKNIGGRGNIQHYDQLFFRFKFKMANFRIMPIAKAITLKLGECMLDGDSCIFKSRGHATT